MNIGIIGAGAWGSALAINLALYSNVKHSITLFTHKPTLAHEINTNRTNSKYFPNYNFPNTIQSTSTLTDLLSSDIILLTTPVKFINSVLQPLHYQTIPPIVICSKGINNDGSLVSTMLNKIFNKPNLLVLSGPSFASEVAKGLPCALTLSASTLQQSKDIINQLQLKNIRLYASDDVIGSQIGGALKNVLAIATGITSGLNLGHSAMAALITRGNYELFALTKAMGGTIASAYGLSGTGDLILTATSLESRNFSLGVAIAKHGSFSNELTPAKSGIAEGHYTALAINLLSEKYKVTLPICQKVYEILYQNISLKDAMYDLLYRPLTSEFNTNLA